MKKLNMLILLLFSIILIIKLILNFNSNPCGITSKYDFITKNITKTTICFPDKSTMWRYYYYRNAPLYKPILETYYENRTGDLFNETDFFSISILVN